MNDRTPAVPNREVSLLAAFVLAVGVFACSIYANLSFAVTNPAHYRFFPPFEPRNNANKNRHLSEETEYAYIARALIKGKGFADPFHRPTGPTAWMPPLLPGFLAALMQVSDGDRDFVMAGVVFVQDAVLVGTGLLILALIRQTTSRLGSFIAVAVFLAGLLCHFHLAFQFTHDCWLVLLALDLLLAWLCWCARWTAADGPPDGASWEGSVPWSIRSSACAGGRVRC